MSYSVHMNSEEHTTDLFWRAEGGTFGSEIEVGLKSILITPMKYETAHGPHGKITKVSDLPRDCVVVKTNLIESGRFNPEKVIAAFPIEQRSSNIGFHWDKPGT